MFTTTESRLWLAVHLLYPNSSQAFDAYQAIILQSEDALAKDDRIMIFSKLISVFEKIPAISLNLSFYEFEFEQIDQWKIIYKNSQKTQLLIFVGVLIIELNIGEIAPYVKLSQDKTQFLFHQMFKKLAQNSSKIKYTEQLSFKKQNDLKISYLYTYENLIEFCLGQLAAEEAEKVKMGLELYPVLQKTKDEYLKIINQIQNLKVQRSNSVESKIKAKNKITLVKDTTVTAQITPADVFYKNKKIMAATFFAFIIATISIFQLTGIFGLTGRSDRAVVMQEIEKKPEFITPQAEIALQSLPEQSDPVPTSNANQEAAITATALPEKTEAKVEKTEVKEEVIEEVKPEKAKAEGGLYRGSLIVKEMSEANTILLAKMKSLGAKKAGEVELGWMKSNKMAYYHFTIPEKNVDEAMIYFKQLGSLNLKFETHPRLIPAGNKRFIVEVKGN